MLTNRHAMSLGYASFSDSAAQELLPMHEKDDQSAFEYKLHDSPRIDQKHSCSNFDGNNNNNLNFTCNSFVLHSVFND